LARCRLPRPIQNLLCAAFAKAFGLDMAEAERPLGSYASIEDLFTRALKPGIRPIQGELVSPADGYLARSAPADQGTAVQAKGLQFTLEHLVYGDRGAQPGHPPVDAAWFQTIYLAPHNDHRVHAPFSGTVTAVRHLPGQLWPVNVPFVARIPRLFARNERLVFDFTLAGGARAWVVMVGAFNVGRMTTPLAPDVVTNTASRQVAAKARERTLSHPTRAGDELGTFLLGSTVVIVYDRKAYALFGPGAARRLYQAEGNTPILMGQPLAKGDPG
jgi:phosphatidylserine decarboxylase